MLNKKLFVLSIYVACFTTFSGRVLALKAFGGNILQGIENYPILYFIHAY